MLSNVTHGKNKTKNQFLIAENAMHNVHGNPQTNQTTRSQYILYRIRMLPTTAAKLQEYKSRQWLLQGYVRTRWLHKFQLQLLLY